MPEQETEMRRRNTVRYSNERSKKITRECIESALIQLMESHDFDKISISKIVERAGVSRTAFYRNYHSKEDVLQSAMGDAIEEVLLTIGDSSKPELFWMLLFTIMEKYIEPFGFLLKAGLGSAILEQITDHSIKKHPFASTEQKYEDIFWAGAVFNVLVQWIKSDERTPANEMIKICLHISESMIANHK